VPNAKIVRTDNSYRLYECLLDADIFVLKMKKCPDGFIAESQNEAGS
jgi:hypothetical protein